MSKFVKVKTHDLSGAALDWSVAKAEGVEISLAGAHPHAVVEGRLVGNYAPSTKWSQGGPLIDKYRLDMEWVSHNTCRTETPKCVSAMGKTPLIAACRAIVASVLGDTVSVPKELLS